jgi:hypothetical protein
VHRHDRRGAEQAAELDLSPDRLARGRDEAHGGGLGVDHADGGLVRDDGRDRLGGVSPGTAIMSSPTEQTQVMASSLSIVSVPRLAAAIMPSSSETG